MTFSAYITIIVANLIGALSPGPDIILVTRLATKSRKHAIAGACGIQVGVLMWATLTVTGAAALLTAFPQVLSFVQLIGGAWLARLGIAMGRGGLANLKQPPMTVDEAEASLGRLRQSFVLGLTTNVSNPKIVLFLAALVAPQLPAHPGAGTAIALILGLGLSALAMFIVLSFVVSTQKVRRKMLAAGPWIDIVAGGFFLIVGVVLAVSGAVGLVV